MSENIREDLELAKKNYRSKNYKEAEKIYKFHYNEHPDQLNIWDRRFYSWSLYYLYVKNPIDENDLFDAMELITTLVKQTNMSKKDGICAYTLSMMTFMRYLDREKDFASIVMWADKINPDFLSNRVQKFTSQFGEEIEYPSDREKYYGWVSKALYETNNYVECIEISKKALDEFDSFKDDRDIWLKWRIAKSCRQVGDYSQSIKYLKEVYKDKNDWFVETEFAEVYHALDENEKSLKHALTAVLQRGNTEMKVNLYSLLEELLSEDYPEEAMKHAYLAYSIRLYNEWTISEELEDKIESAGFDTENTEYWKIEKELKKFWEELKYKDQEIQHGIISKIFPHGNSGFIQGENGSSYYFKRSEFKGSRDEFEEYASVSFYIVEGFNRAKNEVSENAVNIRPI